MTRRHGPGAADALLALLSGSGFERVDTPILQPIDLFLDLSGEDIRRRLFVTQEQGGAEFCLRPEWTIPVARRHLASERSHGRYSYGGPVFRQRRDGPGEFLQVGFETIGGEADAPTDAEALAVALSGYELVADKPYSVKVGDMGLLLAMLDRLEVAGAARWRLIRGFAAGRGRDMLARAQESGPAYAGLLAALGGQDPKAARAFVADVMAIAGVAQVGSRTVGEIAERFLSKADNLSGDLSGRAREVLRRYLEVRGDLDASAREIRALAREERLPLGAALDRFEDRTGFIAAHDIDLARLTFAADFARTLDYYAGFIFEVRAASEPDGSYVAAGGRYDGLFAQLGAGGPIPAIGCSFWLDRESGSTR